jgi:integrase
MSKVAFTAPRVAAFKCPADKSQAFLWDQRTPGLGLRTTPQGKPAFVFQGVYQGKDVRITIGSPDAWTITDAQAKARELQRLIDEGRDPRELKRQAIATERAARDEEAANAMTVGEAWKTYLEERRPHWGERNYQDHTKLAAVGGEQRKRRAGVVTKPGPLAELMQLRLADLTAVRVEQWAAKEAQDRPARVRLAQRLLKAFLRWAELQPNMAGRVDARAASTKKGRELAGRAKPKNDCLQREQLQAWFKQVRAIPNPVVSAYLQCLLLTGARREEMAELKWADVDLQWNGLTLKDKIEDTRPVPLTPYVKHLLLQLPRRNEWVYYSPTSASGHLTEPSIAHRKACEAANLKLTLHGLRRSFASLCEWLEIPGGVSAQIQGHAPQGVREQNYIRRPLDLLRVHHCRIEAWLLEQAQVAMPPSSEAA